VTGKCNLCGKLLEPVDEFAYQTWCKACRQQQWKQRDGKKRTPKKRKVNPEHDRVLPRRAPTIPLPLYGPGDRILTAARRSRFLSFVQDEYHLSKTDAEREVLMALAASDDGYAWCTDSGVGTSRRGHRPKKKKRKKRR
jgi:hypothetical protein